MKLIWVAALLTLCCALVGCGTLSDAASGVREKIAARNEPRVKTFTGTPRVVFEAVKIAADQMGYRMTHGGPAQGKYEGVSAVGPGEASGSARQVSIKVTLHATLDETGTDVSVRFAEILEDNPNGRGLATETTMQDTPLYEVFFRHIREALGQRETAQPVAPRS